MPEGSDSAATAPRLAILPGWRADDAAQDRRALARRLRTLRHAHMAMLGDDEARVEAFAALIGLSPEVWRAYEGGVADPSGQVLIRLRRVTGASIDWLLDGADEG